MPSSKASYDQARRDWPTRKIGSLALESRSDLAYNAAHALALAALRRGGYRPGNTYAVFQTLPHTLGISTPDWRLLALAHGRRNEAEYEGYSNVDAQLVQGVIRVAETLLTSLGAKRWVGRRRYRE